MIDPSETGLSAFAVHRPGNMECPVRWLAGDILKARHLGRFDDVACVEHADGGLAWNCRGHVPAEFFSRLEFGSGMSRSDLSRQAVERLIGHYL